MADDKLRTDGRRVTRMASPSATVLLCTPSSGFRLLPHMVLLFLATLLSPPPLHGAAPGGISCDDCRRCLRGALAMVDEREYNGSAGTTPFPRLQQRGSVNNDITTSGGGGGQGRIALPPAAQQSAPALPAAAPPPASFLPSPGYGYDAYMIFLGVLLCGLLATELAVTCTIRVLIARDRRKQPPAERAYAIDDMREKTIHDQEEDHWNTVEDNDRGMSTCQLYGYEALEAATCHFSNRNKIGSSGFGTVYKGTLENGKEVAVKRLRGSNRSTQQLKSEISIVANLRHKNLVRLLGYCFQEEGRFLVYEYAPNNSLEKFWDKACSQSEKLDWTTWFNIIKGIARDLWYLHNMGVIHRDLKPHNVLLDENFNPKIADFDLMREYDKQKTHESTEKVAGTFGYMAPECTSGQKFLLSIKSDVYSYGVLVLEIITGHKIYTFEGQKSESLVEYVWQHWKERRASDVVDGDLLGVEGQEHALRQALRCVRVALCVQADRLRRPTMPQGRAARAFSARVRRPSNDGTRCAAAVSPPQVAQSVEP